MSVNSSPRTWVAGETVTAAEMNAEIRDFAIGLQGSWTIDGRASSAIWTAASGNPVLNNGSIISKYLQVGKTVVWAVRIIAGSGTTFGTNGWQLNPPLPIVTPYLANASCRGYDSSLSASAGWSFSIDTVGGLFAVMCPPTTQPNADRAVTSAVPFAWATSDILAAVIQYETS